MKTTSKELLNEISKHCFNELTLYTFNKSTLQVSDKYREGRLAALEYIGELVYYYMEQERLIQEQFIEQINKQLSTHSCLDNTDYKKGLFDALHNILELEAS